MADAMPLACSDDNAVTLELRRRLSCRQRSQSQLPRDVIEHGIQYESDRRIAFDLMRRRDDSVEQRSQEIDAGADTKPLQQRIGEIAGCQPS